MWSKLAGAGALAVWFATSAAAQPAPAGPAPPGPPPLDAAAAPEAGPAEAPAPEAPAPAAAGAPPPAEAGASPPDAAPAESPESAPAEPAEAAESDEAPDAEDAGASANPHAGGYERYGGGPGIKLPADLSLHGRFDLLFQRDSYQDHPFGDGRERIQNHHHFLFLSRTAKDDPFGIDVELIDLTFYEVSFTHRPESAPWRLSVRGGKLLVPFGPEPLFHTAYGGRLGFDQKLMPAVWSRLGARVAFDYHFGASGIQLRNDVFAVQGYRIDASDEVLDLQAGADEEGFGFGDRIGIAWGALTGWYSLYANSLGFGRQLVMQAFDAEMYRWPDVPVIDRIAVGLGAMRADVSGGDDEGYGGPGEDYYHFATYFQVKVFPLDWLHVQYRQGITTFDNRRGLIRDELRLDERDNATHNLAVGARYQGFSATLSHAWNLEQRYEVDDDYLRLMLAYDF